MWNYTILQVMVTFDVLVGTSTVVWITAFTVRVFTMVAITGVGVIVPIQLKTITNMC